MTAIAAQAPPIEQTAQRLAELLAAAALQGAASALARRLRVIPPQAWPPSATAAAWDALASAGEPPERLGQRPPGDASSQIRALWVEEPHLVLAFTFDEQLHAAVRALPERHYDHRTKRWTIATTPETATALEAIVRAFDIHTTPGASHLLSQAAQGHAPRPRRAVEQHADGWRIVLPKPVSALDELLLNDVRDLPGRRYVPAAGDTPAHWLIDTTSSDALTALANFVDVHHATLEISADDLAQLNLDRTQAADIAANVTLADRTFDLSFGFDETLLEQVRAISGRVFDPERRVWSLPRSVDSARKLTAILATHQLTISDDATRELHRLALQADQIVAMEDRLFDLSRALDADLQLPDGFGVDLFAFQRAAVLYALTAKRTFLADAQGLGKTIEALAALHAADAFPALVCTKSPMKLSWRDMATNALPGREIRVLSGRDPDPAQLEDADVVICNYDIVSAWAKALGKGKFRALVADDAHVLKEPARMRNGKVDGPQRNYDIKRLAGQVRRSDGMILLLTASPVVKRARDLIGQLTIMGQMSAFGGAQAYKDGFCDPKPTGRGISYDGTTNPQLLNVRLRETCMSRRLKHDVLADLPAKQRAIVRLELPDRDRTRYDRAKADIVAFLRSEQQRTAQASLLPADDAAGQAAKAPALVRLNKLRQLVAEAKLPAVIDWTRTFLDSGEKLILFAEHREIQHALVREFPDCARILGGVSADAAHANAQRFQTDPACQLMVCSLQAASDGLTLSEAHNVCFCEMAWTAAAHDHAEDRGYGRLDNPHGLTAWYLLADGTIDFDLTDIVNNRRALAAAVTDGTPSVQSVEEPADELIARWTR